jgi:hypothetical protein
MLPPRKWIWTLLTHQRCDCEMSEISRLDSTYDFFLIATLCEEAESPLTVLSVLAPQSPPVARADHPTQPLKEQTIDILTSNTLAIELRTLIASYQEIQHLDPTRKHRRMGTAIFARSRYRLLRDNIQELCL